MIQDEMQRVREQISKLILPKIQCSQFCSGNRAEDKKAMKTATKTWGNWTLKNGYLIIKDSAGGNYDIPLSLVTTPARRRFWMHHMALKNWITPADLEDLWRAFRELFNEASDCRRGLELSDGRTASEMVMTKLNEYYPLLRMR